MFTVYNICKTAYITQRTFNVMQYQALLIINDYSPILFSLLYIVTFHGLSLPQKKLHITYQTTNVCLFPNFTIAEVTKGTADKGVTRPSPSIRDMGGRVQVIQNTVATVQS